MKEKNRLGRSREERYISFSYFRLCHISHTFYFPWSFFFVTSSISCRRDQPKMAKTKKKKRPRKICVRNMGNIGKDENERRSQRNLSAARRQRRGFISLRASSSFRFLNLFLYFLASRPRGSYIFPCLENMGRKTRKDFIFSYLFFF